MSDNDKINYLEFPSRDIAVSKKFFAAAFGWRFTDYGPEYCSIDNAGIDGGFYFSKLNTKQENGSVLVVLYSDDLEGSITKVVDCGGEISQAIFSFPGGRRFHFLDPNGNEYALWQKL